MTLVKLPRLGKVNMPNLELHNGTTDPEEHLGVYKAQMYVQEIDDTIYCWYFTSIIKGWLKPGSMS